MSKWVAMALCALALMTANIIWWSAVQLFRPRAERDWPEAWIKVFEITWFQVTALVVFTQVYVTEVD